MHFAEAITIVIASELTPTMVDMLMIVPPGLQTGITSRWREIRIGSNSQS